MSRRPSRPSNEQLRVNADCQRDERDCDRDDDDFDTRFDDIRFM